MRENRAVTGQGVKNKTINKIIENSIKAALREQVSSRKRIGSMADARTKIKKNIRKAKPMPKHILNILYRQNVKNYNPFIEALTRIP